MGLAVGGLAGAATGALLSSSDAADTVDFFTCTVDGQPVWGRFGMVSFKDGENVEVVGENTRQGFDAYAGTRPTDRTIWMYPHCSRGTKAYFWYSFKVVVFLSIFLPMLIFGVMGIISDKPFPELGAWLGLIATTGSGFSFVFAWVAWRFNKFARISDDIFAALDFETPTEVALPKRLRLSADELSNNPWQGFRSTHIAR